MDNKHVLLRYKNHGNCKELCGTVLLACIYVSTDKFKWTTADYNYERSQINWVASHLKKCAKQEGIDLDFLISAKFYNYNKPIYKDDSADLILSYVKSTGKLNLKDTIDYQSISKKIDKTVFLFLTSDEFYSFASVFLTDSNSEKSEYVMIRDFHKQTITHELLHVFGAVDLYYPEKVKAIAKSMYPKSVMLKSNSNYIDNLTKYLIGWHKEITPDAKKFLELTADMTNDEYKNGMKEIKNKKTLLDRMKNFFM